MAGRSPDIVSSVWFGFFLMETPRTNKNAGYYCGHGIKKNGDLVIDPNGPFVLADFARELERDNARLLAYVQALEEVCDSGQLARAQSSLPNVKDQTRGHGH